MTTQKILEELKASGNDATKKIFLKHGAKEPFYGVSVENLKKIQKKIKADQQLDRLRTFFIGHWRCDVPRRTDGRWLQNE